MFQWWETWVYMNSFHLHILVPRWKWISLASLNHEITKHYKPA
jgi:hypothetical protein